jgi:hypothetical protein
MGGRCSSANRHLPLKASWATSTINNIRTQSTCVTGSSKPAYRTDSIDDFSGGWRLLPWYTGIVPKYNIRLAVEVILYAS